MGKGHEDFNVPQVQPISDGPSNASSEVMHHWKANEAPGAPGQTDAKAFMTLANVTDAQLKTGDSLLSNPNVTAEQLQAQIEANNKLIEDYMKRIPQIKTALAGTTDQLTASNTGHLPDVTFS